MRPDAPSTINPGLVLDERYRIIEALGRGGMGSVYRAEHVGLKRPVAIKLLNKELRSYEASSQRLAREAFATGRLDHPNCVSIMDVGATVDGTPYLAMELLEGQSLSDALYEQPRFSIERALRVARHVLYGLAHAHAAGVVHRDLKPDNIFLVERDGAKDFAKILDFGIAKLTGEAVVEEGGAQLTEAGMAIGSPTYMSPEQALGSAIDARTDLYSLSVVLFEMLAGQPPFYAPDDKLSVLRMHLGAPVPSIGDVAPDVAVPAALEDILRRGLAKAADDRVQSADEYGDLIDTALRGLESTHAWHTAPGIGAVGDAATAAAAPVPATASAVPPATEAPGAPDETAAATRAETPSQRRGHSSATAMVSSSRVGAAGRGRAAFVGAALGVGVLVAIVASVVGGDDAATDSTGEASAVVRPDEETMVFLAGEVAGDEPDRGDADLDDRLDDYEEIIDNGRGSRLTRQLVKLAKQHPDNARVHLLLGRAYMDRSYWRDGFDAFRDALRLDDSLRDDDKLIKAALRSLTSRSSPGLGIRFLSEDVGEPARSYLEETIEESRSARQRDNAARALSRIR